ncbi:MAG: spore cortex biosynthesis protein YabQ [Epulopiscium sp.]|nr:spore cortex biosynthesis protein YabQ [Candidatus Epulonipiscium sp.]
MISIQEQMHLFLLTVLTGACLGLLYDGFRIFRKAIPHFDLMTNLEDLLYWVVVALAVFYILFNENYGEVRGFALLGVGVGSVLYFLIFSPWLMKISTKIINIVKRFLRWMIRIVFSPLRWLHKILRKPYIKIQSNMKKRARHHKRRLKQSIKNIHIKLKKI